MATLTVAQMVSYAKGAGLTGNDAVIAGAVGMAESGGRTDVVNFLGCTGIWQIYVKVHQATIKQKWPGEDPTAAMKDPAKNAIMMAQLSNKGKNWQPWEAYTNGSYRKYMGDAMKAAGVDGTTVGDTSASGSADTSGVGNALGVLMSSQTWFRVLWAIGGIILMMVALSRITGIGPSAAVKATPVGKVAKAVGVK